MLADILEFDFLRYTFLTGILIGIVAPLLGTFLVVRRLSLLADALSHVTLAGIAFGLFMEKQFVAITLSPIYSGMGFSVIGAVLIEKLRDRKSTRLNSSHVAISYAVFCLKKKKNVTRKGRCL